MMAVNFSLLNVYAEEFVRNATTLSRTHSECGDDDGGGGGGGGV